MKVIIPSEKELSGFEKDLQQVLEQANLAGYALMGFDIREYRGAQQYEIDALLIMEPGIFVCLEAKGYRGSWTGTANSTWLCDDRPINSVGTNPYKQVQKYAYVIKNKLKGYIFDEMDFWVNFFVVAPDEATIAIEGAVVNQFQPGRSVTICNLSKIVQAVGDIKTKENVEQKVRELTLERIIEKLLDDSIPFEALNIINPDRVSLSGNNPTTIEEPEIPGTVEILPPYETNSTHVDIETGLPSQNDDSIFPPNVPPHSITNSSFKRLPNQKTFFIVGISAIGTLVVGGLALITAHFWNQRPCEIATQVRSQGTCYKNLSKTPLTIGILTSADQYTQLQSYLKQSLGNDVASIIIEGGIDIKYQQAQDSIANKKWDIVFAYSPMNGMRAKDNGYQWVGKMFPKFPETYQSALFVKKDSSIQSIKDIKETTIVTLGDFSSASSFYLPAFDLYGKSVSVIMGNRSKKIIELVSTGKAEVGSVVYGGIKNNPLFRVIQLSPEVPGTGVYLSPELSPEHREKIKTILINAPADLKNQANYDVGEEPNYEGIRKIALRVDEVISCANFNKNPVNFFCQAKPSQQPTGKISGFKIEQNDSVVLRLVKGKNQACRLVVSLKTLSQIPGGTSPGTINHKLVYIDGLDEKQLDNSSCQINIVDPKQVTVLDSSN